MESVDALLISSMTLGISSSDGLEDELFQKNSYIVHNGWQDYAFSKAAEVNKM